MVKVLSIQLREAMREDKGGVYGVGVNGAFVQRPKNEYGITIQFNTDPTRVDELVKTVYDNIDLLKKNGPRPGNNRNLKCRNVATKPLTRITT